MYLKRKRMSKHKDIQEKLGISFSNEALLEEACTHRSFVNEHPEYKGNHNERLEFLGDAVLELVVTEFLFSMYPSYDEGTLSGVRAWIVNTQSLAKSAESLHLDMFLRTSKGEEATKGKDSLRANMLEAIFGALYLDRGYEQVKEVITTLLLQDVDTIIKQQHYRDPKSVFQEKAQEEFRKTPTYMVVKQSGPDHDKLFVVSVYIGDKEIAQGEGSSKQEAETNAARTGMYVFKKT